MIYFSSTCSKFEDFGDIVDEMVDLGIRNIELSGNLKFNPDILTHMRLLRDKHRLNLMVHHYFPPPQEPFVLNLASQNPDIRKKTFSLIQQVSDLIEQLDIPVYGVHGGHCVDMLPEMKNLHFIIDEQTKVEKQKALKTFQENVDYIIREFSPRKRKMAVENLFVASKDQHYALLATPDQIDRFMEFARGYDNLGLLLDLGHLNVTARTFGFDAVSHARFLLKNYSQKIFQLHLSENDGSFDVHHVHKEDSWQLEILEDFSSIIKGIPITFEWFHQTNSREGIIGGIKMIQEKFGASLLQN